ncbi:adenosylmethionine--8-amino-7-oxononanoate transaminase [Massilia arenosa]|uniref:Adenosylmethionine-8-amino-7-oxononanoate aminotransferase n=1 Tax=Zemynaea arenosa TaxID=2561931 RepID=A0A4Y9RUV4_9BURK|nr:adenosylmethionine--8-amino-7-oxononanoate transaminase [Massilia arenosa]TFW11605.1 adenosylmethionine--8-amino-7-oxononanoate transaminase [Massilia arenosa]
MAELNQAPGTASQDWVARSLRSVWHPCTQMQHHETVPLIAVSHGRGVWLYDHEGKRYLDGISSWWVNLFGHANRRINAELRDQLDTLEHAMLAGFTHEPVVQLSEQLSALTGGTLGHAFYASDGASAVEIALKMSFHYWRNSGRSEKQEFVCLEGSYHGETIGALAVTDVALFKDAYGPLLRAARTVASPDARLARDGETTQDVARRAAADVEKLFAERADKIAAIIVEPLVQCATGMAMHDPLYLTLIRELCDRYQVHLICDEIAVGCGRTGTFFASEQAGIWPDFLCLSKGISGGYLPLSIVLTRDSIYQAFYDRDVTRGFLHSHSYTGNPLACRAALATLAIFRDEDVLARNRTRAAQLNEALHPLADHPRVRNARQRGMIWAFDAIEDDADKAATFSRRFFAKAVENELLLRPIGRTMYLMPPYVLSDDETALLAERTLRTFEDVIAG